MSHSQVAILRNLKFVSLQLLDQPVCVHEMLPFWMVVPACDLLLFFLDVRENRAPVFVLSNRNMGHALLVRTSPTCRHGRAYSRDKFKLNRTAALAEWRQFCST